MKCDIGINPDGRPFLEIRVESMSEATLLRHFAKALGLSIDESIGTPTRGYLAPKETPTP